MGDGHPQSIGRYEVLGALSVLASAVIYKAKDPDIGRFVTIRLLKRDTGDLSNFEKFQTRFRQEVRAVANLRHPRILGVLEFGMHEGAPFVASEFVEGEFLSALLIKERKLPLATLLSIASGIAGAIDYIHSKGVLHRGIRPASTIIDPQSSPFLADLGLIGAVEEDSQSFSILSRYRSPELLAATEGDARSDLFSFSAVLYEMATGRAPFVGLSKEEVFSAIQQGNFPVPSSVSGRIPKTLDAFFAKALSPNRAERFSDASGLYRELNTILSDFAEKELGRGGVKNWGEGGNDKTRDLVVVDSRATKSPRVIPGSPTVRGYGGTGGQKEERSGPIRYGVSFGSEAMSEDGISRKFSNRKSGLFSLYGEDNELRQGVSLGSHALNFKRVLVSLASIAFAIGSGLVIWTLVVKYTTKGEEKTVTLSRAEYSAPASTLGERELRAAFTDSSVSEARGLELIDEGKRRSFKGFDDALTHLLRHRSYVVRLQAIRAFSELGDPSLVQRIAPHLDDVDPLVRSQTARTLARLGGKAELSLITARLGREMSAEVRKSLEQAISELEGKK